MNRSLIIANEKNILIAVHDGDFHGDDAFSVAYLIIFLLSLGVLRKNIKIIRTRNQEVLARAHYCLDVCGVYDPESGRVDHHIHERDIPWDKRENGIPYATFGLLHGLIGKLVCGSTEAAAILEEKLVLTIDAADDNCISYLDTPGKEQSYSFPNGIFALNQTDEKKQKKAFTQAVCLAEMILAAEICKAKEAAEKKATFKQTLSESGEQGFVVLNEVFHWGELAVLLSPSTLLYIVSPREDGTWQVKCVSDLGGGDRKKLPKNWWNLSEENLSKQTGVPSALYCHHNGFMVKAKTKKGAIRLAELAIEQ